MTFLPPTNLDDPATNQAAWMIQVQTGLKTQVSAAWFSSYHAESRQPFVQNEEQLCGEILRWLTYERCYVHVNIQQNLTTGLEKLKKCFWDCCDSLTSRCITC